MEIKLEDLSKERLLEVCRAISTEHAAAEFVITNCYRMLDIQKLTLGEKSEKLLNTVRDVLGAYVNMYIGERNDT